MMRVSTIILGHFMCFPDSHRPIRRERWGSAWEAPDEDLHLEGQWELRSLPSKRNQMHLTMKYQIEKQKSENIEKYQRYTRLNRRNQRNYSKYDDNR